VVFSISPEIHQEDIETIMELAQEHGINTVAFWLDTWPTVSNPQVSEETIRDMIALENKYPTISVFFDMNPSYVVPATKNRLS